MIEQSSQDLEFKSLEVEEWRAFKPEKAERDGARFLRKAGSNIIYRKVDGALNGYRCNNCTADIMDYLVAHPIWDGPFEGAGSGRCYYEAVPYCPKCETEKPEFSGLPIRVKTDFPLTEREKGHLTAKLTDNAENSWA